MFRKKSFRSFFEGPDGKNGRGRITFEHSLVLGLVIADKLLKGGKGFREAREQIAEGDKQVANGEDKVNVGERRLDAGKLELRRGREQLRLAKRACVACALGAAFFASVSIVLGFRWRRSPARIFIP